jgi:DNA-binding IscR family transcriptional regulator
VEPLFIQGAARNGFVICNLSFVIGLKGRCHSGAYTYISRAPMIATRFAVSVHLLALLAQEYGESMSSEVLADSVGVNPVIVRTLMGKMRKAGLVKTKRGVPGATQARPLQEITLLHIFDAVELGGELFSIHDQPQSKMRSWRQYSGDTGTLFRFSGNGVETFFVESHGS